MKVPGVRPKGAESILKKTTDPRAVKEIERAKRAAQEILNRPQPREVNMDRNPKRTAREMAASVEDAIESLAKKRTGMGIRDLEIRRPRVA